MHPQISIKVGPVIGKVTDSTARILAQFNKAGQINCVLTSTEGNIHKCHRQFASSIPIAFKFEGLKLNTKYVVSFQPSINQIKSSFKTISENADGTLRLAIFSCNDHQLMSSKNPESELWVDLQKRVQRGDIDYMLHMGDSVYMDLGKDISVKPYQRAIDIFGKDKSTWEGKKAEVLELIRDQYRRTWTHPPCAAVLAQVPRLTICDDHQIRDDWGTLPKDYDPNSDQPDYIFGQLCKRAYYEYQRQLREDVDFSKFGSESPEYHYHILNGIGIYFVDYRADRSWNRQYSELGNSFMGKKQWNLLESLFGPEGEFSKLTTVLFVTPTPLVVFSKKAGKIVEKIQDDYLEHWTHNHPEEQVKLLGLLNDWKKTKKGRQCLILTGDIHVGGHTKIYHNKKLVLRQFTASPMNMLLSTKFQFKAVRILQQLLQHLQNGFSFEHDDWTRLTNYGLVNIKQKNNQSQIKYRLVASKDQGPPVMMKQYQNISEENISSRGCNCSIF